MKMVEKACEYCGGNMTSSAEGVALFARRRFCSVAGATRFQRHGPRFGDPACVEGSKSQGDEKGPAPAPRNPTDALEEALARMTLPGAKAEYPSEVPPQCVRCGSPWRLDEWDGAFACTMCGRRYYVAASMKAAMRRRASAFAV